MYRSMIESQSLGNDVGQLVVSLFLFSALRMLSELLLWDNSEGQPLCLLPKGYPINDFMLGRERWW